MDKISKILFGMLVLALLNLAGCSSTTTNTESPDGDISLTDGDNVTDGGDDLPVDGDEEVGDNIDGDDDTIPTPSGYAIVDTGQITCFDAQSPMICPSIGEAFFGQDAQHDGEHSHYRDNGDGTVTDLVTGLMWQQDPGDKQNYYDAINAISSFNLAGYADWRVPTIKELYSLILFSGRDVDPMASDGGAPFIDNDTFAFSYGDTSSGERIIDSQWVTSSIYTDTVMGNQECFFGVNFADGRIKCYPTAVRPQGGYFAIYVRDAVDYGKNDFTDNDDGTVTDAATGLMWQKNDSGNTYNWEEALAYCESLELAGYNDWKLPNAKQLQSLVDYDRSPGHTNSAAIDPIFNLTGITNEAGQADFGFYWSGTTHANQMGGGGAAYVAFGRSMGYMNNAWMDVHGAGAQRSDPKMGDPNDYPNGNGPQGDAIHIYNFVRCLRDNSFFNDDPEGNKNIDGDFPTDGDIPPVDGDIPPADGDEPVGPTACSDDADCQQAGACPEDAVLGCVCERTPQGDFCIPSCNSDDDCPETPDQTLTCGPEGVCIPGGGPPQR